MDRFAVALLVVASAPLIGQEYVGSAACASCHRAIFDRFKKSPMGRSMSPATDHLAKAEKLTKVEASSLHRTFEAFADQSQLQQSEAGEGFRNIHPIAYAIGSGVNGVSFIVRRDEHLFQAPLSWYSRTGQWGLSPGYEAADYAFNRPIATACIACHSGRPKPVPETAGRFNNPAFDELAIGCENCHGPGSRHAASSTKTEIVNPARLARDRADDVCMNCHQGGDTRIPQPGKSELDFRPGMALSDVVAIFRLPQQSDSDLLEHHESMRLSKCYRVSSKLSCITCHQPHAENRNYNATCIGCHSAKSFPVTHPAKESNCVGCHMPKREVGTIAHSALTNHRIIRSVSQPKRLEPDRRNLIYFNQPPSPPLPLLTKMRAYGQLMDRNPAFEKEFQSLLDQAATAHPANPLVLAALGRRALRSGDHEKAIEYLQQAQANGSQVSATFEDLAEALSRVGKLDDAVTTLRAGLAVAPYSQQLYKSLALRFIRLQRYPEAKHALERYIELFPEDDFVRKLLRQVSTTP